jgi:DNA topoisomerase-2
VVDIRVSFPKGKLTEIESEEGGINKLLKLSTTVSTSNMHLFDKECKLKKYENIPQIIDDFYEVRLETYVKRKTYLMEEMSKVLQKLTNKARFIQGVLEDTIDLRKKDHETINSMLNSKGFDQINDSFDYLIKLPMNTVSKENVEKLLNEKANVEIELAELEKTSVEQIWLKELNRFEKEYRTYKIRRSSETDSSSEKGVSKPVTTQKMVKSKAVKK